MHRGVRNLATLILVTAVAACAPPPVKVAPAPVQLSSPSLAAPTMPLPPGGAALSMALPPVGVDGIRTTPNRGLSRDEQIWHFRSALNVAALNCQGPVWGQIATEYNKFIVIHKVLLSKTSRSVDREYVKRYPKQNGLRLRDTRMTDLYNYFALPPVRAQYCDMALRKLQEVNQVPKEALPEYAMGSLVDIDNVFVNFYDAYAKYERDLADWNMRYAPKPAYNPANNIMVPPVTTQPAAASPGNVTTPSQPR